MIRSFEYRPKQHALEIKFTSGRRYLYHDVPERMVNAMQKATSKGSFFNRCIRDHFEFTRCE